MILSDLAERQHRPAAGIGIEDIDAAGLGADLFVEAIEIGGVRRIRLDTGHIAADFLLGRLERVDAAAGDEDVRAFGGKQLGGSEADAAGATGDDSNLAVETIRHRYSP
jgi:hypothetical protein